MKREDLTADKVLFGGIVYYTMIIGEAAYNLTKAFCKIHPETPWGQIAKMRHNLAHGYYQVDPDIVWSSFKTTYSHFATRLQLISPTPIGMNGRETR